MGVILFAGLIRVSFVLSEGNSNAPKKLRLENKKGARSLINVNNLWEGNAMKRVNKIIFKNFIKKNPSHLFSKKLIKLIPQ